MPKLENVEIIGEPVQGVGMHFKWNSAWVPLFDKQIEIIRLDILRARFAVKLVTYLSCPISSKAGGRHETNVEISEYAARRIVSEWGQRVWVLNPTQYQMESKVGRSLIEQHAESLGIDMRELPPILGGDYLRMWVKILAEDDGENLGGNFDFFYFLSLEDVRGFLADGGACTITAGAEEYFTRKYSLDAEFRSEFTPPFKNREGEVLVGLEEQAEWARRRREFISYYSTRGGANFSRGSHDEWNLWRRLNELRNKRYGIGFQIPAFQGGTQIQLGASELVIFPGYEVAGG